MSPKSPNRQNNVRPFAPRNPDAHWRVRLAAAAGYLIFGLLVFRIPQQALFSMLSALTFPLFAVVALLYWGIIQQRRHVFPYFFRYHLLQSILLNFLWFFGFQLVYLFLAWLGSLLSPIGSLGHAAWLPDIPGWILGYFTLLFPLVTLGIAVYLTISTLFGKMQTIPFITENVRYWA